MDILLIVVIAGVLLFMVFYALRRRRQRTPGALTFSNIPATVTRIEETKGTRIVRTDGERKEVERISYVIVAQGRHPNTNSELTFRSFPMTDYPRNYPVGKEITVALDLSNSHNYKMQIK
jgi:hypothetical protein